MESLGSRLPFKRKGSEVDDGELLLARRPRRQCLAGSQRQQAAGVIEHLRGSRISDLSGPASLLEVINQSFEVMQTSLAQYKIAGYPPDILINIPKRVCRSFEFYKAPELIQLGRIIAHDTLDKYERDNA